MKAARHFARVGHGTGKGTPHVEVGKAADLPAPVPAAARPVPNRDSAGRLLPSDGTRELARRGGLAAAQSRQLGQLLGLEDVPADHPYAPYARLAREWRDDQMAALAADVGGGHVGPGPASIVSSAALQLGASRWLADQGAAQMNPKLLAEASKLSNDSRQNLLAAHSLVVLEAEGRGKRKNPLAHLDAIFEAQATATKEPTS